MAEFTISDHYDGDVQIKFYPNSHRYKLEGEKTFLVGVTTCTGMLDKSRPLLIWATRLAGKYLNDALEKKIEIDSVVIDAAIDQYNQKRDEAATSGTMVHEWAESYIAGKSPEIPEDEQVRNGALAFLKWVSENDVKFLASEKKVYSKKYKYVGTMDCIFTMGSENHKIIHAGDFKTSSGVYVDHAFQLAAYQEAESEEFKTVYGDKYILKFDKKTGGFESKCFPASEHTMHFEGFLACLKLKELSKWWDKEHGYYSKKK